MTRPRTQTDLTGIPRIIDRRPRYVRLDRPACLDAQRIRRRVRWRIALVAIGVAVGVAGVIAMIGGW